MQYFNSKPASSVVFGGETQTMKAILLPYTPPTSIQLILRYAWASN
jgi:hypothetical protein